MREKTTEGRPATEPLQSRLANLHTAAWQCYHASDKAGAERYALEMLRLQPLATDAVYLLGVLALDHQQPERALLHFHHATKLEPGRSAFHNALGESYRTANDLATAEACFREAVRLDPANAAAHHALGLVRSDRGDAAEAVACFRRCLGLRPDHERAQLNLGRVLLAQNDAEGARVCFAAAIHLRPDYALAHNNLGAALQALGRHGEAVSPFRQALRLRPDYPEAYHNLGLSLLTGDDPTAAGDCFREALRLRPEYARAHLGLGRSLEARGELAAAAARYQEAARLQPEVAENWQRLAELLLLKPDLDAARLAFEKALALRPQDAATFSRMVYTRQLLCDWQTHDADLQRLHADAAAALARGEPSPTGPFFALTLPWPADFQLAIARRHAAVPGSPRLDLPPLTPAAPLADGRLRIGYLSAEFRDHAVSHLTADLFGRHDRRRFEVFGYSFGAADRSSWRERIVRGCDHFRDLATASLAEAARTIRADGLHVLIDMQGHIGFPRLGLLALRLAPVQCHFVGFPGTIGADTIDYLIGDPVTTPLARAADFHEKLVLLPHCYLPTDSTQTVSERPGRAACGLPETGFVFCGFGNRYKIEPGIFGVWMRLLEQVPDSVLWLSAAGPTAEANLRREAVVRGVDPGRLVFAKHAADKAAHLARHREADLFLDTLHYNAHTTAVDALWGGLPVLTTPGETFASRVGASLLTALGLPELITPDLAAYEVRALHLATHPAELMALRQKLETQRTHGPLFDTAEFVRNLERALGEMWARHAAGHPPRHIVVGEP